MAWTVTIEQLRVERDELSNRIGGRGALGFAGIAVAGALLGVAVNLADEAVDVDHEALVARAGARLPRALEGDRQDTIELGAQT